MFCPQNLAKSYLIYGHTKFQPPTKWRLKYVDITNICIWLGKFGYKIKHAQNAKAGAEYTAFWFA